jgi:hypothetical protein
VLPDFPTRYLTTTRLKFCIHVPSQPSWLCSFIINENSHFLSRAVVLIGKPKQTCKKANQCDNRKHFFAIELIENDHIFASDLLARCTNTLTTRVKSSQNNCIVFHQSLEISLLRSILKGKPLLIRKKLR